MGVLLGDEFPNFLAKTTQGDFQLHDYIKDSWCIFFSHPHDYTPVCTTELGRAAKLAPEFAKRGVKMIAISCNDVDMHNGWIKDIQSFAQLESSEFPYPIIQDQDRAIAVKLGMLDPDERDKTGMPVTARACFVIGPDRRMKLSILYPATTGRNFDEILRVIDSLQLSVKYRVATPVDWKVGDKCMIQPSVTKEEAEALFPKGYETVQVPSGKEYIRLTPHP